MFERLAWEVIEEGSIPLELRKDAWESVFLDCDDFPCILVHVDNDRVGNVVAAHVATAMELDGGRPGKSIRSNDGSPVIFLSALLDVDSARGQEIESAKARLEMLTAELAGGSGSQLP